MIDLSFWGNLFLFLLSSFLAFYIPGAVLTRALRFSAFQKAVVGTVVGVSLWTWQGYVFGFLNIRSATYLYVVFFLVLWLKNSSFPKKITLPKISIDWVAALLIGFGVIAQTSIVWFTGIQSSNGIMFCCGDASADIYHLGLTYSLVQKVPPFEPGMANTLVTNYHYWSNLSVAELVRIFHLPILDTEFRFMAPLISLFLGLLAISISQLLLLPRRFTRWLLFFLYLSGDFIFLIQLASLHTINLTMGPLENGTSFLENPPRAFAIVVFFAGLFLLIHWFKKKHFFEGFLVALLFASTIGFKIYIGIFALSGLFFLSLFMLWKKQPQGLLLFGMTFFLSLIVYLPTNSGAGGLYFTGFWRFEEFGIQPSSGVTNLVLAMQTYRLHNNWAHIFINELILFVLFIFGEFGTKLLALFQSKKSLQTFPKPLNIFLISALLINLLTGLFFQQNAGGSNSFNFLVSVYIIASFYAALSCTFLLGKLKKPLLTLCILFLIFLNIPRIWFAVKENIKLLQNPSYVSSDELKAMNYLRLSTPEDSLILSDYTPYLIFIANRPVFLNNFGILESHTVDTSERRNAVKAVFRSQNPIIIKTVLKKFKINYIYMTSSRQMPDNSQNIMRLVYSNQDVKIFKVLGLE